MGGTFLIPNDEATPFGRRYILHNPLGAGSMGAVYRTTDRLTGQQVALKRVLTNAEDLQFSGSVDRNESRKALIEEFKTLSSLRHPHIITVRDYGFDIEGYPFFTMDLLETPRTILGAGWSHPLAIQVSLLVQVLQAIGYLHRHGILHRDLKPGNVLVTRDQQVRVVDFGLAAPREKAEGAAGTLAYMAPEILNGDPITTATDLWAVGVMAYQLMVGTHPFDTSSNVTLLYDIINREPNFAVLNDVFADDAAHSAADKNPRPAKTMWETRVQPPMPGTIQLTQLPEVPIEKTPVDEGTGEGLDDLKEIVDLPTDAQHADHFKTTILQGLPPPPKRDKAASDGKKLSTMEFQQVTITSALANVLAKLLHKEGAQRYQDAFTVIRDLCASVGLPIEIETAATRESFLQSAPFLGRDTEIKQLSEALDDAAAGHGSAWLVAGESGVGKSRLLMELRTQALVKGIQVVRGQQVVTGGALFQVWRTVLRWTALLTDLTELEAGILMPFVPDIALILGRPVEPAPELDPAGTQQRLLATIVGIFRRQSAPLLLILEDMQWAGDESLAVLQQVMQVIDILPMMVVATYRADERPDLASRLPDMHLLELGRFPAEDITRLAVAILGEVGKHENIVQLLKRETEGNAFFLVEVIRALAEEAGQLGNIRPDHLPTTIVAGGIEQIIRRRVEKVPEWARGLLKMAAVAGRRIHPDVLHVAEPTVDIDRWLLVCAEASVIEVQDERWQFSHDKVREWLVKNLTPEEQPELHRKIAVAMEQVYSDPSQHAASLANHWHGAGDPRKEREYVIIAGEKALAVSNFLQARDYFKRALTLNEMMTDSENLRMQSALNIRLGQVHWGLSEFAEAREQFNYALEMAQVFNHRRGIMDALRHLSNVELDEGNYTSARQHLYASLTLALELQDLAALAHIYNVLGEAARIEGEVDEARQHYETSLRHGTAANDQAAISRATNNLGFLALKVEDYAEARRQFEASLTIDRILGDRKSVGRGLNNLAYVLDELGEYPEAKQTMLEGLAVAQDVGDRAGASILLDNLGAVSTNLGEFKDAARYLREAFKLATAINYVPIVLDVPVETARLLLTLGQDLHEAVELLGMAINHPASIEDIRYQVEPLLEDLRPLLPTEDVDTIVAQADASQLAGLLNRVLLDLG